MVRLGRKAALGLVAAMMVAGGGAWADDQPIFKPSSLPPDVEHAPPVSFFEVLQTTETSPLGTPASSVKPTDLISQAASFLNDGSGHKGDPKEAAFWLKRAVLMAPDESGKRRAWAVTNLAIVIYNSGDENGHAVARYLWQIAGAWHNAEALCNLGKIAMLGDDVAAADPKEAIVWYQRAKAAGCTQADQALSSLQRH